MNETQEQVKRLIALLEHVRKRAGTYMSRDDYAFEDFMSGAASVSAVLGIQLGNIDQDDIYLQVLACVGVPPATDINLWSGD